MASSRTGRFQPVVNANCSVIGRARDSGDGAFNVRVDSNACIASVDKNADEEYAALLPRTSGELLDVLVDDKSASTHRVVKEIIRSSLIPHLSRFLTLNFSLNRSQSFVILRPFAPCQLPLSRSLCPSLFVLAPLLGSSCCVLKGLLFVGLVLERGNIENR